MYKLSLKIFGLLAIAITLAGCTPANVEMSNSFWQGKKPTVAIVAVKAPTPAYVQEGDIAVLNFFVNDMVASGVNSHVKQADLSWYNNLPNTFAKRLQAQNIKASIYHQNINLSTQDYSSLRGQLNTDELLIIKLENYGVIRRYHGSIPMGSPKGYCDLSGELIDLTDNKVLWRYTAEIKQPIDGQWDQPPAYPNLTAAVQQAAATAQEEVVDSFFSGH